MTNKTTTKPTRQRNTRASVPAEAETPLHVELAAEAVLEGWTRSQVLDTLIGRISRDRKYLAYRKACNRRTSYDDQVQQDMRALALAVCWLTESPACETLKHEADAKSPTAADAASCALTSRAAIGANGVGSGPRAQRRRPSCATLSMNIGSQRSRSRYMNMTWISRGDRWR